MKPLRRLLHLEDDRYDADLTRRSLTAEWPDCAVVLADSEEAFTAALAVGGFDLILADFRLPSFDGLAALALARKLSPGTPVVFLSGALGDEAVVEILKAGATDYVLKDRPARLVPVIRRALNEAEERSRRQQVEKQLRQSEEQYRNLFEHTTDLIHSVTPEGRFVYVNRAWQETLGYSQTEVAGLTLFDVVHPEYHEQCREQFQSVRPGDELGVSEVIFLTKQGRHIYLEGNSCACFESGKPVATRGIFRDVTEKKMAEVALKRSIREYEALVNAIDGIVWQAELPGLRFHFVSQQSERLLGYPVRCWLEEPTFWQDHIHPEDRERAVALCTELTPEQKYQNFEYRMLASDGRVVWLRDIVSVGAETGEAPRIQGIMLNITARKQAEAARRDSEALKATIMEAALDCIIVTDHEGKIIEFNPAAEKTFGYSRSEILGQPVAERMVPPALRERHQQGIRNYLATGKGPVLGKRIEITALRADGSEFPVELAIIPIQLGERPVFTAYLRDITTRKRAEEKMARIQAKLETSNQEMLRKNQEIQNFYHTLSHELKTPLTSAREFVSIVMDGLAGPVNETQKEYLGIAKDSCNQLRACINDLLDATRLETGKLKLELKSTALDALVHRVVAAMGPAAAAKNIALSQREQPGLPAVPLDEHRMTQVISNLLNNALKYTSAGGQIVVTVGEATDNPALVQVSVSDTGSGIPKEEQERIFDRLYQVKTGDAATEQGVGLGLYLCRELVQLHGGRIWVESAPGRGSTFSFVVPKSQELLRSNLLVVDDDPDMIGMLRDVLQTERYNVRSAHNGLGALQQIQEQVPDIILLDLAMPELDGAATLKEIRKNWGNIPVIVHTGHADGELMKQALAFSPLTLLAKPCSVDQILETVRKVQSSGDTAVWSKNHYGLPRPHRN